MGPEAIARLLNQIPLLRVWADAVEGHALALLLKGEEVPGYKLVAGRSNRTWDDPLVVTDWLVQLTSLDEAAPRVLLSPAQAEKLLRAHQIKNASNEVNKLAVRRQGAPTIAPNKDPRPELSVFAEFDTDLLN